MADSAMVEAAIVNLLGAAIYPNGTSQPSIVATPVKLARGWPTEAGVAEAVGAGYSLITVHATKGFTKDVTRYPRQSFILSQISPTITVDLSGYVLTIGGTVTAGNTIAVLTNGISTLPFTDIAENIVVTENGIAIYFVDYGGVNSYNYVAVASDTINSVASALALLIPGATASANTVTLTPIGTPQAVVVNGGTAATEIARTRQMFSIECWSPSPAARDSLFNVLPGIVGFTYRLALSDGTFATMMSQTESGPDDVPSRMKMFRRDIRAVYDYPVIATQTEQAIAAFIQNITPVNGTQITVSTV